MDARQHTVRRGYLLIAVLIVGLGGVLRFAYIGRGYTHPDEPIASAVVAQLHARRGLDTDWAHTPISGRYGRAQYNFSSYYLVLAGWDRLLRLAGIEHGPVDAPRTLASGLEPPEATAPRSLVGFRAFSALLGTLVLILAMRLAGAMSGWWLALGVGAWLAVNPQLVQDSHYARPEAFLTLGTLGLVLLVFPNRRWTWPRGAAAGALFGFLTACKITMLLLGWLPLLVCFAFADEEPGQRLRLRQASGRAGVVGLAGLAGFIAGVPRVLADWRGWWAGEKFLQLQYAQGNGPYSHFNNGPVYDYLCRFFNETTGWWIAALFVAGMVGAVFARRRRLLLTVFAPVAVTAVFFGAQTVFFERNLSHVVPLYAVGAAGGVHWLAGRIRGGLARWKPAILLVALAAMLFLPASLTTRMDLQGFSGKFAELVQHEQSKVMERFPNLPVYSMSVRAAPKAVPVFQFAWKTSQGPFLAFWVHANDEFAQAAYQKLPRAFRFTELGRMDGLFRDLDVPCGLRDYFPTDTRVLFVEGPREGPFVASKTD